MTRKHLVLSRREREIMDVLYQKGQATVSEVMECLHEAPGYSAVRSLLRILESKGHIKHLKDGTRYVYVARVNRDQAKRSEIRRLIQTFFNGSPAQAVAGLLDESSAKLSEEDLDRLEQLLQKARKEGKP
jgi:predicted transcriptional regulator